MLRLNARKAIAWLLFAVAMLVWGFICAMVIVNLVGFWTQGKYALFVVFIFFMAWVLLQAREWWEMAPWKL